ncbi:cytochrome c [Roseovarius sp. CAU 1744]|uniref:c-type cytochrome n=1 Tax=Roseovarius sp. CAU 1744 TaxID=3140368 RepID=UPI00325AD634
MKKNLIAIALLLTTALVYWVVVRPDPVSERTVGNAGLANLVEVKLPQNLSPIAEDGKALFDANCIACHGQDAAGNDGKGPPLVHKIYEPSHHGDESFQRAVALGVRGHHWRFGDMPPVQGVAREDVEKIVRYVRELQIANGIE